jgi:hypothetical protein
LAADRAALDNATRHLLDPQDPSAGFVNAPPVPAGQHGLCSQPFDVDVPLFGARRRTVTVVTLSSNAVRRGRRQVSWLRLTCLR